MNTTSKITEHVQKGESLLVESILFLNMALRCTTSENTESCLSHFWTSIERYYHYLQICSEFTCRKNCYFCCFDNPHGVTGLELQRIIPFLTPIQKKKIQEYYDRFQSIPAQNDEERQIKWKQLCNPCPMLEDKACSIYSHRPLACRSFFSEHTPERCHPNHEQYGPQPQIGNDDIHIILAKLSQKKDLLPSSDLISGLASLLEKE